MIVITLSKVPPSLRGDLTKWYQEVQTGVYVGNVNAKVRDQVWERIERDIGSGQAVMVYNAKNELGYQFKTTREDHEIVDFDGIPLLKMLKLNPASPKLGFSNASRFHKARIYSSSQQSKPRHPIGQDDFAVVDIETSGLDSLKNEILSIGAVKKSATGSYKSFFTYIKTDTKISNKIVDLTGINNSMLSAEGVELKRGLRAFLTFIENDPLVGYNLPFDDEFLTVALKRSGLPSLKNRMIDLMPVVKKQNRFIENFKLSTVLKEYSILNEHPHHADSDAMATYLLAEKLMKNGTFSI